MHPMTRQECEAARLEAADDGLAPWSAAGWAALIFLGAGSVIVDRWMPADTAMAALADTPAPELADSPAGAPADAPPDASPQPPPKH